MARNSLVRALHTTARRADMPRSPFQVFVETLRQELTKSREFQDNIKQLQGESAKFQDTETMRKAREAYERARIVSSIKHNPRLQAAAEQLRKSGGQVSSAIGTTLRQMEESELMRSLSAMSSRLRQQIEDSTAPVRNTGCTRRLRRRSTRRLTTAVLRLISVSRTELVLLMHGA